MVATRAECSLDSAVLHGPRNLICRMDELWLSSTRQFALSRVCRLSQCLPCGLERIREAGLVLDCLTGNDNKRKEDQHDAHTLEILGGS